MKGELQQLLKVHSTCGVCEHKSAEIANHKLRIQDNAYNEWLTNKGRRLRGTLVSRGMNWHRVLTCHIRPA